MSPVCPSTGVIVAIVVIMIAITIAARAHTLRRASGRNGAEWWFSAMPESLIIAKSLEESNAWLWVKDCFSPRRTGLDMRRTRLLLAVMAASATLWGQQGYPPQGYPQQGY